MGRTRNQVLGALGLGLGLLAAQDASAQQTPERLLQLAAGHAARMGTSPVAAECAHGLLTRLTTQHSASPIAVSILFGEMVDGIDVAAVEAQAGRIGAVREVPSFADGAAARLPPDDLALFLARRFPDQFTTLCEVAAPEIVGDIAAGLGQGILAYNLRDIAPSILEDAIDELADVDIGAIGTDVALGYVFDRVAVGLLDLYASTTGATVDSEAIVAVASPAAKLIVAAGMGAGGASAAFGVGVLAYTKARGAALSSYAEDERFALATRTLVAADAFRRAAFHLRAEGRADDAIEIEALAAAIVNEGAAAAEAAFRGSDGPLAASMLRDMDEVVQLLRQADEVAARERLLAIQAKADAAAPGLFSLSTNNFYERYFMIGPQHRADSVRAYLALHETMHEIFEADRQALIPPGQVPVLVPPLPSEPDAGAPDPWLDLAEIYADDPALRAHVAASADYALLAWAGYEDQDALDLAAQRGWVLTDRAETGGTLAVTFVHGETGETVVSFRGSLPAREIVVPHRSRAFDDWLLTNVAGSLDPFELTTNQLTGAEDLALRLAAGGRAVTFVGHSKGGRLAQIAHLATGQPAYGFNSAPLGAYELRRWPFASRALSPTLQRFRAPRDLVTLPAAWSALGSDDSHTVRNAAHGHGIESLALAMLAVAELDTLAGAEDSAANAGRWGRDIVWTPWPQPGTCPRTDTRACLAAAGVPEPALDFAFAADPNNWGDVYATAFFETGAIDVVRMAVNYAPYEDTRLLNGSPDIYHPEPTRTAQAVFADATSQRLLRSNPDAYAIYPLVAAHRLLPDGTQRFVLTESILSGARAAAGTLGVAYTFLDYPAGATTPTRRPVAILELSSGSGSGTGAAALRSNPADLQAALNSRGYDAGEIDGFPGPQTRSALMAFQADQCLAPTGQPDMATAEALVSADRFNAPCAGAGLPDGVSAIMPLLTGIYVDDPAKCGLESLPFETVYQSQRIIDRDWITFGQEGGCMVSRTDIREGGTLFRGTCYEADHYNDARWTFDVTSNDSFIDRGFADQDTPPRAFLRCGETSPLRQAWSAWFDARPPSAEGATTANQTVVATAPPPAPPAPPSAPTGGGMAISTVVMPQGTTLAPVAPSGAIPAHGCRFAAPGTSPFNFPTIGGRVQGVGGALVRASNAPRAIEVPSGDPLEAIATLTRDRVLDHLRRLVGGVRVMPAPTPLVGFEVADCNAESLRAAIARVLTMPEAQIGQADLAQVNALQDDSLGGLSRQEAEAAERALRSLSFAVDLGLPGVDWEVTRVMRYDHQSAPSAPRVEMQSIGLVSRPDSAGLPGGFEGNIPLVGLGVAEVLGIFETDAMAEVQFRLAATGPDIGPAVLGRAEALGLSVQTHLFTVSGGERTTEFRRDGAGGILTAVYRKYDDGWRLWAVR